ILDPRGGGGGTIAMNDVAHSKPDGYTLVLANTSPGIILPLVSPEAHYDTARDFTPVVMIGRLESFLVAGPSLPAHDLAEVLQAARSQPGTITYAVLGAAQRVNIARLEAASGAKFLQVPFTGTAAAETALMGGFVQLLVTAGDVRSLTKGGAL